MSPSARIPRHHVMQTRKGGTLAHPHHKFPQDSPFPVTNQLLDACSLCHFMESALTGNSSHRERYKKQTTAPIGGASRMPRPTAETGSHSISRVRQRGDASESEALAPSFERTNLFHNQAARRAAQAFDIFRFSGKYDPRFCANLHLVCKLVA